MTVPVPLELRLHPKQAEAAFSPANELFFGGAAGGGKSYLLRALAIMWCMEIPNLRVYLFRRLFPELKANHMEGQNSFPELLAPWMNRGPNGERPLVRILQKEIQFTFNGSRIFMNHCQHEANVLSFQGPEIHVLMIDEVTHWTQYMVNFLRSRLRGIKKLVIPEKYKGQFPRCVLTGNPGGIGHLWVKKEFVEPGPYQLRRMSAKDGKGGMVRQFIPSLRKDNSTLDGENYEDRIMGLGDPALVRAMLLGDWSAVKGAMFGDVWDKNLHTCEGFPIPLGWKLWRGADDGYASPAACYWLTQSPDTKTLYVVAELYAAGMLPDTFAARVLERDMAIPRSHGSKVGMNQEPLEGILDSAAFSIFGAQNDYGQKVPSRGEQMNARGCRWKPAEKPPGSRVHGIQELHRLFAPNPKDPQKRPGLIFFRKTRDWPIGCENAIDTIPALPRDPKNPEDILDGAEDHAADSIRYAIQKVGLGFRQLPVKGA